MPQSLIVGTWNPRIVLPESVVTLRAPSAAGLFLGMALMGLTDAVPGAKAQAPKEAMPTVKEEPQPKSYTVSGRCVNQSDSSPQAGVSVRRYQVEGRKRDDRFLFASLFIARILPGTLGAKLFRYRFVLADIRSLVVVLLENKRLLENETPVFLDLRL
jgi:hypothetical protein